MPLFSSGNGSRKKNIAVAGVASLILLAMVVALAVALVSRGHGSAAAVSAISGNDLSLHSSTKAIKTLCKATDFQETCVNNLSSANVSTSDPKKLLEAAFNITINSLKASFNQSALIRRGMKDPRTRKALENCGELLEFAMDDLRTSLNVIGPLNINKLDKVIEDVKLWLSASITYQETCLDGFKGTRGTTGSQMRKLMTVNSELTRDILAIVTQLSRIFKQYNIGDILNRKLLQAGEVPNWISDAGRRLLTAGEIKPDVVVAKDGSSQFKTIGEAVATVPLASNKTFVIHIKEGVYQEQVVIEKKMWNVFLIGDGADKTRITGNLNYVDGTPTFNTATVAVMGEGFTAQDIGFENSAGPEKHQAVALRVQSDKSIFYRCKMDGYQDTLYFHTYRQFYRDCTISGTIDFLFGNAAVVFQNCKLVVRKPLDNQQNIITAQGRKDRREPTGLIIQNCTVEADTAYEAFKNKIPTFLGRPWKMYSRTIYIQSDLGNFVKPAGWLPWNGPLALNTCFYAEFENRGAAAVQTNRVKWRGIKTLTQAHAQLFTVESFIGGNLWLKSRGVPYIPGLVPSNQLV